MTDRRAADLLGLAILTLSILALAVPVAAWLATPLT